MAGSRPRKKYPLLRVMLHDIACGLHSGIPECCVDFFARLYAPSRRQEYRQDKPGWATKHHTAMAARAAQLGLKDDGWGYVPCPTCLKDGYRVKAMKSCDGHQPRVAAADAVLFGYVKAWNHETKPALKRKGGR